jgi:hypothetical protein
MSKEGSVMFQDVKVKGLLKHIIIGIVVAVFSGAMISYVGLESRATGVGWPVQEVQQLDAHCDCVAIDGEGRRWELQQAVQEPYLGQWDFWLHFLAQ